MTAAVKGGAPKVAPRIRLRIEQVISTAMALGKCDATRSNPAATVKAVRPKAPKGASEHFRRIGLDAAPGAFRKLHALAQDSTPLSALVFMILTAARPSEALAARWDQIDLDKKLWMNPVSKTGKLLPVPLSPAAIEVLERQARVRVGDAVFPGRGGSPASYAAFSVASRSVGFDIGNPHAWSIFRDWAEDKGGFRRETADAALGHSLGAVKKAYRRETGVEARGLMMAAYANWLTGESEATSSRFRRGRDPAMSRRNLKADRFVVLQPNGSFASLPAWMTEPAACDVRPLMRQAAGSSESRQRRQRATASLNLRRRESVSQGRGVTVEAR
jgi:hypothetical protein